jgi:hypothetical protein
MGHHPNMTKALALLLIICAMTGLPVGQEASLTIREEVESAFVYPSDGDQPFGKRADDVVYGTVVDPVTDESIQEITWRGIEMRHERGFTPRGWVHSSDLLEVFTIVNNTDYPVSLRPGEPASNGCKVRLKKHHALLTVQPRATIRLALRYAIGDENGTYRTTVRLASRDFVFPGELTW